MKRITIFFFVAVSFTASAQTPKLVKWYTLEEAQELNKKEPRKFFIDIYTDWCGWCKKMDAVTFENPVIASYLNEKYYPIKFNAEVKDSVFFKNKKYGYIQQGARGINELTNELMGDRMSYPTVTFLDEGLNKIQAIPGFREAPEMHRILFYFGDNYYRTTDYQQYLNSYVSPFTQQATPAGN